MRKKKCCSGPLSSHDLVFPIFLDHRPSFPYCFFCRNSEEDPITTFFVPSTSVAAANVPLNTSFFTVPCCIWLLTQPQSIEIRDLLKSGKIEPSSRIQRGRSTITRFRKTAPPLDCPLFSLSETSESAPLKNGTFPAFSREKKTLDF